MLANTGIDPILMNSKKTEIKDAKSKRKSIFLCFFVHKTLKYLLIVYNLRYVLNNS